MQMQAKYRNSHFTGFFFSLKFVSSSFDSITSLEVISESSIILAKFFSFSKLHVAGFQT